MRVFRRFALLDNLSRGRYNEKSEESGNGRRGASA